MENKTIAKSGFARIVVSEAKPVVSRPLETVTRREYLKLVYPNGVTLILPMNIDPVLLSQYIHAIE